MKIEIKNIVYLLAGFVCFSACEDVIEVDLKEGDNQLVVDAWITNASGTQSITLSRVLPYFDTNNPPAETGATVTITEDNGTVYHFEDADNDGVYTWTPQTGSTFGRIGGVYELNITTASGVNYAAISAMKRIMPVDSIVLEDREDEELGQVAGIYAEFFARGFSWGRGCLLDQDF